MSTQASVKDLKATAAGTPAVVNVELEGLLSEVRAVGAEAESEFGHLDARQLNWKPSAAEWSIAQCFDHLITTNESFYPDVESILRGEKRSTFWERLPVLPGLWGKMIINRARPEATVKSKAPTVFAPSTSEIDGGIIRRFAAHQKVLVEKMEATARLNLGRIVVTSPVASFVTYCLLDAYRILVFHERRHFLQGRRVAALAGFPARSVEGENG